MSELSVHWAVGGEAGAVAGPDVAPHGEGVLELAPRSWKDGEILTLQFYRTQDLLVDEYHLPIGEVDKRFPVAQDPAPTINEDESTITVSGTEFRVVFDKNSGLILSGIYRGTTIITGGPYLNLVGIELSPWIFKAIRARIRDREAVVDLSGSYDAIEVRFELRIDGQGLITTAYTLDKLPNGPPRARPLRVGLDVGGYREVGVAFTLSNAVDRLTWERRGRWSAYPDDHIGRTSGVAYRVRKEGNEKLGERPTWPWAEDKREYSLFGAYDVGGRGTRDFRSMKHNIWHASAIVAGTDHRVRAESDGTAAVRLEVQDNPNAKLDDRDPRVNYVGTWIPIDGEPKSYHETEMYSNKPGDYAELTFQGTGVCWIGSKDLIFGKADVYVDGVSAASEIDLYSGIGIGASRGEEKIHQQILFSRDGLENGEHTIRVVVTGQKNPRSNNSFVPIDAFMVLGAHPEGDVRFIINNEWNYPELTWGNYVKDPILIGEGYGNEVRLRLTDGSDLG